MTDCPDGLSNPLSSAQSAFELPLPVACLALVTLLIAWCAALPAQGQFRSYLNQGQTGQRQSAGQRPGAPRQGGQAVRYGGGTVYPQFRHPAAGVVHWLPQQMPLKVYVSRGLSLDGFIDEQLGAPILNVNNLPNWPRLAASVIQNPEQLQSLPAAQGFTEPQYQAAIQGINMWKPFEKEGLFSFVFTDDPARADIYVFFVHHFVDKLGLALFAGDIRGYTSKTNFPYKAIMAGGRPSEFTPVVIVLRTTEANGLSMPPAKMKAAAAHEFGHALGIEDHSSNPADLMSVYYGSGVLSANDTATIRYLYRLNPDSMPMSFSSVAPAPSEPAAGPSGEEG